MPQTPAHSGDQQTRASRQPATFTEYLQNEIRAEMSRQRITQREMCRRLGPPWTVRLTGRATGAHGYTEHALLTVQELDEISRVLGLRIAALIDRATAAAAAAAGTTSRRSA